MTNALKQLKDYTVLLPIPDKSKETLFMCGELIETEMEKKFLEILEGELIQAKRVEQVDAVSALEQLKKIISKL